MGCWLLVVVHYDIEGLAPQKAAFLTKAGSITLTRETRRTLGRDYTDTAVVHSNGGISPFIGPDFGAVWCEEI